MQSHKHAKTKSSSDSQVNSSNDGKDPRLSAITNDGELEGQEHHREMLAAFRCLIADLCEQFGGGHPGYVYVISSCAEARRIRMAHWMF